VPSRRLALGLLSAGLVAAASMACSEASRLNMRCIGGDMQRCRQLGDMYATCTGVGRDMPRAAELYEKVCDAGVADVCNTLGEMYEQQVVPSAAGSKRSEDLFNRACSGGSTPGCLNVGLLLSAREDFEQAARFYDRSCTGGLTAGCHYLAAAIEKGEGVAKDVTRAVSLYDEACDAEYIDSCLALATLFTEGTAVEADAARVTQYYAKVLQIYSDGCEAGNTRDCGERDRLRTRIALQAPRAPGQRVVKGPDTPDPQRAPES
jgi:TPR repeat protein